MPNKKNLDEIKNIEKQLEGTQAIFLADYAGLDVKAQGELREKVREAGGELKVTKNTLLKLALKNKDIDADLISKELTGPNITLFATDDLVAPLKALVEFAKEHDKPEIKAGILGKEIISMDKITQLASLPSKEELISMLIRQIQAPLSGIANVLSAPTRNLVYAISALKDKKETSN